jgi:drug/metabolite transporter (DMT)-like permease
MDTAKMKGHVAMLAANSMWGLMAPLAKFVMIGGAVSSLVMTDLRVFGAMILFWIFSFFQKPEHVGHKDLMKLFVASLLAIVFNQGSYIFGVGMTSPVDASIITTSMPLIAMILAAIFLKEPITSKKILGIAVGASGALLLILGSSQASGTTVKGDNPLLGDVFVLLAQCSYAFYFVLFKNFVTKYSAVTVMKWMFTYAFICLLPFSYSSLLATDWLALDGARIASILFVVVGATFLSYILIIVGQKNLRPTVAGMYNYIQPLVATIVAICWGMDSFNLTKVLSVVMIFGGVWLVTSSRSRAEMEAYKASKGDKGVEKAE